MSYSIEDWFDDNLKEKLPKIDSMDGLINLLKEAINRCSNIDKTDLFRKWVLLAVLNSENEDMGLEEMLHQAFNLMQRDNPGDLMQIKYKNRMGHEVTVDFPNHEDLE